MERNSVFLSILSQKKPRHLKSLIFCHAGMAIKVVEFSSGAYKIGKIFALKSTYPNEIIWIIGVMGRCQKVPTFDFQSQFSMTKIIEIFFNFFSRKNINLAAHFYLSLYFSNDPQFLTAHIYTNSQNSIIFFGCVDF